MNATRLLLAALSVMFLTTAANAQWISFTDETSTRLVLEPFVDDPNGDPMMDDEEKDIGIGDLNKDGRVDAVVVRKRIFSNAGARQDVLLMQNARGKLVDRTEQWAPGFLTTLTDSRDVLIRDFDNDGWLDVVICNTFGEQPRIYMNQKLMRPKMPVGPTRLAWKGLADETATRFPTIQVPQDVSTLQFCAAWAGDIDGDGSLDIYFSNYNPGAPTTDVLFMNDGDGNFTNETAARLGNLANVAFGTSCEIHDVDNDGDNDIIKTSTLYNAPPFDLDVFILYNDGTGHFFDWQPMGSPDPYMFTLGDLNGNGWLDMYIVEDSQDKVALADSNNSTSGNVIYNTSTIGNSPRTEGFGGNIHFRDIDGDGDLDLGVAPIDVDIANCGDGNNSGFCLLRNDGNGGLTDPYANTTQNFNLSAHDYEYIDVNGDGRLDLILCLCEGWRVLIQDP